MKTIYISGPITDLTTGQPREGWQQDFLDAEAKLRQMGFSVINPVDIAREVDEEWQQQWSLPGNLSKWNGPIANAFLEHGPTRGTYITACLQRMNDEAIAGRLHGVYVIGSAKMCQASHGVQMELLLAEVLDLPIYAECFDGGRVNCFVALQPGNRIQELLND